MGREELAIMQPQGIQFGIFCTLASLLLSLSKGHELKWKWDVWEEVPSESQFRIFLFNLTNPDEFEVGEKPFFQEIGPYVFTERRQKVGIVHSENKSSVGFREVKTFEFLPSESVGSDDDLVTIVNIPLLTFGKILAGVPYVGPNFFKSLVKSGEKLSRRNERVGDVLYYGFEAEAYVKVLKALQGENEPIPEQFSGGRFGLFKGRNGTDDGLWSIGTGSDGGIPYGKIISWRNESTLHWWGEGGCNVMDGIRGVTFDPTTLSKIHLSTFDPDICRSLRYTYHGKTTYGGQIPAWKYNFARDLLEDGRVAPSNLCFCPNPGEEMENCFKKGVIDLASCRNGAPLVLSYPHFFHADESYGAAIGGMMPNKSLHHSAILVEPKTGTVLQETKRFQLNVHMKALPSLSFLKKVPEYLLPVFWSERIYTVSEEAVGILKEEIQKYPHEEDVDEEGSWKGGDKAEKQGIAPPSSNRGGVRSGNFVFPHLLLIASVITLFQLNLF